MAMELIYTSAPRGLQPGTQGFCTVAATRGMSPLLMEKLESLTGYKALFPPNDPKAHQNPTAFFHYRLDIGGQTYHVVGRLGSAGLDYTGRTNKFAHFVVLEPSELPDGGPAWLLMQPGFLKETWDGPPQYLDEPKRIPRGDSSPNICRYWQQATGDAGWGGALVESFQKNPTKPVILLYELGDNTIPLLFAESLAFLPPQDRWDVGFSTYYNNLGPGIECHWRGAPADFTDVKALQRSGVSIWLLSNLDGAQGGPLVQSARDGRIVRREVPDSTPIPRGEFQSSRRDPLTTTPPPRTRNVTDGATPKQGGSPIRLSDITQPTDSEPSFEVSDRTPLPKSYSEDPPPRSYADLEPNPRTGGSMFLGLGLGILIALLGIVGLELVLKSGLAETMGLVAREKKDNNSLPGTDDQKMIADLKDKLNDQQNLRELAQKKLSRTEEDFEKEKKKLNDSIQKQQGQIEQIQTEQTLLKGQLRQKNNQIEQLNNQIAALSEKLNGGNPTTKIETKKNPDQEEKSKEDPIVAYERVVRNGKGFPDWDAEELTAVKTPLAIKPNQISIVNWPRDENGQAIAEWEVIHPRSPRDSTGWYMIADTSNPKKINFILKTGGGSIPFAEMKLEGPGIVFGFLAKPTIIDERLKFVIRERLRSLIVKASDQRNIQLVVFRDLEALNRKLTWKLINNPKQLSEDPRKGTQKSYSAIYSADYNLETFEYFPNRTIQNLQVRCKDVLLEPLESKEKKKDKPLRPNDHTSDGWHTFVRDPKEDPQRNEKADYVHVSYSLQDRSLKLILKSHGKPNFPNTNDFREPDNYTDTELQSLEVGVMVEKEFILLGKVQGQRKPKTRTDGNSTGPKFNGAIDKP